MKKENEMYFKEFLLSCEEQFGWRRVNGSAITILEAFEQDTIEEFVNDSELTIMSLLCSLQIALSEESPDMDKVKDYEAKIISLIN